MQQTPVRVLIAEDDYLVGEMIRGMLEGLGYAVVGDAINGQEAVTLTQELRPDVVLMDWSMPDMDGIAATKQIFELCPTPVVILSAHSTRDLLAQAGDVGAGAYLVKPPSRAELDRAITIARARFDDMIELRRLNADLEIRNADLDAFARIVAHDLNDPLALLIGYAGTIEMFAMDLSDAEIADLLNRIVLYSQHMATIVDELLLLVHLRKSDVILGPVQMQDVVQDVLARMQDSIRKTRGEVLLPATWPAVLGYAPWIAQVWVNYLSNALKYGGRSEAGMPPKMELGWEPVGAGGVDRLSEGGPRDSTVVASSAPFIRFWLRDNGMGLTPEEQARLFQPFSRLDSVRIKGHGLGLSIVRFIVEKLGGTVAVESVKGQGSTFSFTLPAMVEA